MFAARPALLFRKGDLFAACGQTAIRENADFAAASAQLSKREQEETFSHYFKKEHRRNCRQIWTNARQSTRQHIQITLRKNRGR